MINEKIQIKQLLQTKARHIEVETKLDDTENQAKNNFNKEINSRFDKQVQYS